MTKNFLLVETGVKDKRFVLDALKAKKITIYLACAKVPEWARAYIPEENLIITDTQHSTKLVADVAAYLEVNNVKFHGVGTFYEQVVAQTAVLAQALGLVGVDPGVAFRSSCNKVIMRQFCREAGVRTPRLMVIRDLSEQTLSQALKKVGVPCVIKPVFGADSYGAKKLESDTDLAQAINEIKSRLASKADGAFRNFTGSFLIEEYFSGPMFSVDGIVQNNKIMIAGMAQFIMGPEPRFVQEGNYLPADLDAAAQDACIAMAKKVIRALGLNNCGFHCELRITPDGPALIEIAARLCGGIMLPEYKRALGVDMTSLMIDVWLGKKITMKPVFKQFVWAKAIVTEDEGVVTRVEGVDKVQELPFVWSFKQEAFVGQKMQGAVPGFPKLVCHYAVSAPNKQSLDQRAREVEELIQCHVEGS